MDTSRMMRAFVIGSLSLAGIGAAGCGGDSGQVGDQAAAPPPAGENTTPGPVDDPSPSPGGAPSVVGTDPANGAKGVKDDAAIVVTFDRAMDTGSVEAAYASSNLPADQVTFAWNASKTELTIAPKAPLAYATGDQDVVAKSYAFTISTAAKDEGGRPLAQPLELSFSTLREITQKLPYTGPMTGRVLSNGTFSSLVLAAGDVWSNGNEYEGRAVMTFLLQILPDEIEVKKATIRLEESDYQGTPDISFGAMQAHHVIYPVGSGSFDVAPLSTTSVKYTIASPNYRTIDVTEMFADDVAHRAERNDRSQYRLSFPSSQNGNAATDMAFFDKGKLELSVAYLAQ